MDTFTEVDMITLNTGEAYISTAVIDLTNGFIYAMGYDSYPFIVKISLTPFSRVDVFLFPAEYPNAYTSDMVVDEPNKILYAGDNMYIDSDEYPWGYAGVIYKIDLSTLTLAGVLLTERCYMGAIVIDQPNGAVFIMSLESGNGANETIYKVRLSDFTVVEEIDTQRFAGYDALIDQWRGLAYFSYNATPGGVLKLGGLTKMNPASKDVKDILEAETSLGLVFQTNLFVLLVIKSSKHYYIQR